MKKNNEGVFVPKKVIIRMIFLSVFINIMFLLMGMVIGKEDGIWKRSGRQVANQTIETQPEEPKDDIEVAMSIFEDDSKREQPVDVDYLKRKEEPSPAVTRTDTPHEPTPTVTEEKPSTKPEDPPPKKKEPKPDPKKTERASNSSGQFYIQVIASKNADNVNALNRKVQGLGYTSFTERDGDLVKLFVGFYDSEKEAAIEKLKIDRRFKVNSWVRQK